MCGLVGIAGDLYLSDEKVFQDLLVLDVIRGRDSTGVATAQGMTIPNKTFRVAKHAMSSPDFVDTKAYNEATAARCFILMGHNRAATRGKVVDENAHPFEFEHVIGAHNGSLVSHAAFHNGKSYAVDSQALYSELNENGVDSMWGKTNGPAALTWIDKRTNQICFLRNSQRPLHYIILGNGKTIAWASETWMLHVALSRNNMAYEAANIVNVPVNTLHTITLPSSYRLDDKVVVETREVKPYVAPVVSYAGSAWKNHSVGNYKDPGQGLLKEEKAVAGGKLLFYVEKIDDHVTNGRQTSTVTGRTPNGTMVKMYNIDSNAHEDMLADMWENDEILYRATISWAAETHILLMVSTCESTHQTLTSFQQEQSEKTASVAGGQQESAKPAETKDVKYTLHKAGYSVSCSQCRGLTSDWWSGGDIGICCTECYEILGYLELVDDDLDVEAANRQQSN